MNKQPPITRIKNHKRPWDERTRCVVMRFPYMPKKKDFVWSMNAHLVEGFVKRMEERHGFKHVLTVRPKLTMALLEKIYGGQR